MSHGRANAKLRNALLDHLGITQQALSARAQKKNRAHQLSTPESIYLIADDEGLTLADYLGPEELERARKVIRDARAVGVTAGSASKPKPARRSKGVNERVIRFPSGRKFDVSLLGPGKISEAVDMAGVYPLLYLLENSMRELVSEVLEENYGADWWEKAFTSAKAKAVVRKASERMQSEATMRKWHQRRGDHPIYYVDLDDIGCLIFSKKADFFPDPLSDDGWFSNFIKELVASRNVLCHMNPLDKNNMDDLEVKYNRWHKLVKEYRSNKVK